jgi:hypothetical protein
MQKPKKSVYLDQEGGYQQMGLFLYCLDSQSQGSSVQTQESTECEMADI